MLVYIRSCKYCGNALDCSYKREIRDNFKPLRLDATAVVNCKRVRPFHEIGDKVSVCIYTRGNPDTEVRPVDGEDDSSKYEEIVGGILVGYVYDRYGHARTYAVRIPRSYIDNFEPQYYVDGELAKIQFPDIDLGPDEIIVFIRYTSIESGGKYAEKARK